MTKKYSSSKGRLTRGLLATGIALCLVMLTSVVALASGARVAISDAARVLNYNPVYNEGTSLPSSITLNIYTTNNFVGTLSNFQQRTRDHVNAANDPRNTIVMAIDSKDHYIQIDGGSSVSISNSQYSDAITAFKNSFHSGDYTGATIASIDSLRGALGSSSGGGSALGVLIVILVVLLVLAILFFVVRRIFGFRGRPAPVVYQQPFQPGYGPNYGPNYGPGYNQGGGVNPLVAGGLGAAAGGFIGYELGKESAENQYRDQGQGQGGNFGGGAGGSFGGDGGQGGGGGGGDFGGGAGGDFGGGGGGGGGGGDFGGGGGGGGNF